MSPLMRRPTLGLALGGGGARGLAHIGVLKVLLEEGFKPDYLAGTSMGGIIAGLYACGFTLSQLEEQARKLGKFSQLARSIDRHIMRLDYLIDGGNVEEFFEGLVSKDCTFESLKVPLALAAVDLRSGREVTLQSGRLAEAMHASMALPGIIEPVDSEGRLLVDGGSLNNVPADLVRSMGAEVVAAVDVSPDVSDREYWESQKLPGIAAANWKSNAIMVATITRAKLSRGRTDVVIRPQMGHQISTLSGFKYAKEIIANGEKAAKEALPQLRRLLRSRVTLSKPQHKPARAMEI